VKHRPEEVWTLSFVGVAGRSSATVAQRVRQLLKHALRVLGLRCVRVAGPTPEELRKING
jgi:hypothetical protein